MKGPCIHRDSRGAAAAEMALVTPLLLVIMIGSVELGSYFYNEHILVKAVRDGARYAARQDFSYYGCSGAPTGPASDPTMVVDNTRALVRTSLLAGGPDRFADIADGDITLSTSCKTTQSGQTMSGIYRGAANGAPIVTVSATVDYAPVIGAGLGFSGAGLRLNASEQAAVMGL